MKNNLQTVELAFPKNMMSSSRSEFNMPTNFAKVVKKYDYSLFWSRI